ncbi:hypothetical protein IWQ62_005804, partial [Dispira parvispora]
QARIKKLKDEVVRFQKNFSAEMGPMQNYFRIFLQEVSKVDKGAHLKLRDLKDNKDLSADDGNKILDDIIGKWKKEVEKEKQILDNISPKQLKYDELNDVELFIYFPLLHARKYGSPRYVAQLLSHIKSTLIDNRNSVNQENTGTSCVALDDELFYEAIIPQVLLAYVHDEGIRKAKRFVYLTDEDSYHLYDNDDQEHWPARYIELIDSMNHKSLKDRSYANPPSIFQSQTMKGISEIHKAYSLKRGDNSDKPVLTLALAPSDHDKQSKLADKLQSNVEK